jgi:SAM-dependent methyltransferase
VVGVGDNSLRGKERTAMDYDAELRRHTEALRAAWGVQPHHNVLDIGCGTGQTTRLAARTAVAGSALGVDISAPAVERARALARAEGLANLTFERADAQLHRFPPAHFDVAVSRFGTMFFDDPAAAFTNIGRALQPTGRLVMMVWQAPERNEWNVAIQQALRGPGATAASAPEAPDPFTLSDPAVVADILTAAGFADVTFTDIRQPIFFGPDLPAALDWVGGFTCIDQALKRLDRDGASQALRQLRDTLAAHASVDGVWFDSRAWIVTARRASSSAGTAS